MTRGKRLTGLGAALGMLVLILDGKTAAAGARAGVGMCLESVIPSLFPFIVLSILLTNALSGTELPILRPLVRLCGLPEGAGSLVIAGFLGGYPVGAQAVTGAYRAGQLEKKEAERMLGFCSNAGPAFLFGICGALFPSPWAAWVLWGIHILSAVIVARLLPGKNQTPVSLPAAQPMSPARALNTALRVMGAICGWIVLFRMVMEFMIRWFLWLLPVPAQAAVLGFLELTNGCLALRAVKNGALRFVLCAGMLAFGGCCVVMQTASVIGGLSMRWYLTGKLLQTGLSVLLAAAVVWGFSLPVGLMLLLFAVFSWLSRKKSSNRAKAVV